MLRSSFGLSFLVSMCGSADGRGHGRDGHPVQHQHAPPRGAGGRRARAARHAHERRAAAARPRPAAARAGAGRARRAQRQVAASVLLLLNGFFSVFSILLVWGVVDLAELFIWFFLFFLSRTLRGRQRAHSVPPFSKHCVSKPRGLPSCQNKGNGNAKIHLSRVGIGPTGHRVYRQTLWFCATTILCVSSIETDVSNFHILIKWGNSN